MTERPDGSLAPVTYLFGDPVPGEEPSGRSSSARSEALDRAIATHPAGSRWTVPGVTGVDEESEPDPEPSRAEKRARNVSLAALARRGMSVAEMRDLLERRELEPELIEQELATLTGSGLLDDESLAENLLRSLTERKGMGASAIRAELRRRRLDAATIEIALDSLDGDDEYERALGVAEARARQLRSLDRETAERRLTGFLQRRGYSGSTLTRAVREALGSHRASGSGPRFQ